MNDVFAFEVWVRGADHRRTVNARSAGAAKYDYLLDVCMDIIEYIDYLLAENHELKRRLDTPVVKDGLTAGYLEALRYQTRVQAEEAQRRRVAMTLDATHA